MATLAGGLSRTDVERRFFTGMAVAMLLTAFIGFAPTYYLLSVMDGVTVRGVKGGAGLTPLVHVHAILFSAWMLLFLAQTGLVAVRRTDLHRAMGMAGLILAAAVIVVGPMTAIAAARNGSSPPGWGDEAFLVVPFTSMLLFAGFTAAGFVYRRRTDYHKRLMLLGTIAMLVPALSRLIRMVQPPLLPTGVYGALILVNLFLLALVAFDLRRNGKLHRVTIWGIAVYLISWPVRLTLGATEPWQAFARFLIA